MKLARALEIVYELARQNALDPEQCHPELQEYAKEQQEALAMVHDFAINHCDEE